MARKQYMFRSASIAPGSIDDQVPGDPTRVAATPCILCCAYEIEEEFFGDLEEYMETQKWEFVGEVENAPPILPLLMAGSSGVMYDVTIDDSDPHNPKLAIAPTA